MAGHVSHPQPVREAGGFGAVSSSSPAAKRQRTAANAPSPNTSTRPRPVQEGRTVLAFTCPQGGGAQRNARHRQNADAMEGYRRHDGPPVRHRECRRRAETAREPHLNLARRFVDRLNRCRRRRGGPVGRRKPSTFLAGVVDGERHDPRRPRPCDLLPPMAPTPAFPVDAPSALRLPSGSLARCPHGPEPPRSLHPANRRGLHNSRPPSAPTRPALGAPTSSGLGSRRCTTVASPVDCHGARRRDAMIAPPASGRCAGTASPASRRSYASLRIPKATSRPRRRPATSKAPGKRPRAGACGELAVLAIGNPALSTGSGGRAAGGR